MPVDPNSLCTLSALKAYLGITATTDDALLESCIDRASATVEGILDRKIVNREYWEWRDCGGTDRISVRNPPITKFECLALGSRTAIIVAATRETGDLGASVHVTPTAVELCRFRDNGQKVQTVLAFGSHKTIALMATAINATTGYRATASFNGPTQLLHPSPGFNVFQTDAYLTAVWDISTYARVDYERGIVSWTADSWPSDKWYRQFPKGYQNVLLHYFGGFDPIPYDITQAAIDMAASLFRERRRDAGVASESLGDYSYSLGDAGRVETQIRSRLARYRRIR
jgi:hypothetical protein